MHVVLNDTRVPGKFTGKFLEDRRKHDDIVLRFYLEDYFKN
jgi:hypothetical protein